MARGIRCVHHGHYDRYDRYDHDGCGYCDHCGHYDQCVLDALVVHAFREPLQQL